jgi:hypothetical protein
LTRPVETGAPASHHCPLGRFREFWGKGCGRVHSPNALGPVGGPAAAAFREVFNPNDLILRETLSDSKYKRAGKLLCPREVQ